MIAETIVNTGIVDYVQDTLRVIESKYKRLASTTISKCFSRAIVDFDHTLIGALIHHMFGTQMSYSDYVDARWTDSKSGKDITNCFVIQICIGHFNHNIVRVVY